MLGIRTISRQMAGSDSAGFAVVEVLVSLAIAALVVVTVGNVLAAVRRLDTSSERRTQALSYARQALEIASEIKNSQFACVCTSCVGSCTRASDGQSCALYEGYTSCWTEYAVGLTSNNPLHLEPVGPGWRFAPGAEVVTAGTTFTRQLTVENLADQPNMFNRKKITVRLDWTEQDQPRSVTLSTIVTSWEKL